MRVLFSGLSDCPVRAKSTLAHAVEEQLHQMSSRTFVVDGDNVRYGLNMNLGFPRNRKETIRRIGEMCELFIEAGVIALAAFSSPYREDREMVQKHSLTGNNAAFNHIHL
jgi:adenylylsulfate kinase